MRGWLAVIVFAGALVGFLVVSALSASRCGDARFYYLGCGVQAVACFGLSTLFTRNGGEDSLWSG